MKHAVIMAGGVGTRLWPLSRANTPKQFQSFIGEQTLIRQTFERIIKSVPTENVWVMTNEAFVPLVKEQLPEVKTDQILAEPEGRNTAAATIYATLKIHQADPDALIFGLLPADHYIGKEEVFTQVANAVFSFLETHREFAVTIGINPTEPNTGLGYIKMGEQLSKIGKHRFFKVDSFHEKPDLKTAEEFVESWEYLWNGGYYIFSGAEMIEHYRRLAPTIIAGVEKYLANNEASLYAEIPSEPIDKAIAEKLESLAVVPADMEWSDIGNWATLHEILGKNGQAVSQVVLGNHIGVTTERSLIFGDKKLIATVGLEDIVIVDTDDAILVAHRDCVQDVKKVVEQLQQQNKKEYL